MVLEQYLFFLAGLVSMILYTTLVLQIAFKKISKSKYRKEININTLLFYKPPRSKVHALILIAILVIFLPFLILPSFNINLDSNFTTGAILGFITSYLSNWFVAIKKYGK
jgi:uncharacterized membrane protein